MNSKEKPYAIVREAHGLNSHINQNRRHPDPVGVLRNVFASYLNISPKYQLVQESCRFYFNLLCSSLS